jgi:hypothetical protein
MSKVTDEMVLGLVEDGPVPVRSLRGRSAQFWMVYRRLLASGQIIERGGSDRMDPKYVGMSDAKFPPRKLTVKLPDLCLLMLAGATEEDAKATLQNAIDVGGEAGVRQVCGDASDLLLSKGAQPGAAVRNAVNRHRTGKPFRPLSVHYDIANKPLEKRTEF